MKKFITFLVTFIFFLNNAQNIYRLSISSADDKTPISYAKVISEIGTYYTNEEGVVLTETSKEKIKISAPRYEEKEIELSQNKSYNIELNPLFKDLEEVTINAVNINSIFQEILKNYTQIYYSKPSLYTGIIKQKAYIDKKINNFLIADITTWSKYNAFNFAERDFNTFFQMNLDNIRHFKTSKTNSDYPFNNDVQFIPNSFVQKMFLNSELVGILSDLKNLKTSGYIINDTAGIQQIKFKTEPNSAIAYSGYMIYNKNDNAIIFLEVSIQNLTQQFIKEKNKLGEEYIITNDYFKITYDFIKRDYKYIPTQVRFYVEGNGIYKEKKIPVKMFQDIIFQKFSTGNSKGLKKKIDLLKNLTDNISINEAKEDLTILTREEREFLYGQ